MAALHSALQALGPCKFEDIPRSPTNLEPYLQELFRQAHLILDSIPIPPPDGKLETRPRSHTTSSIASNASEISSSSARSAPPKPERAVLQKEWGKPIKLSAKDNPLNMAVYRMGGKDGKGAWFARRSVQEGLGFAKFKKSLEMEFPESLAVQGAPGEGNIRGIGGDKKVEDISIPGKGRVEVFQLIAQFPGPTTPRDFVTLLVTSSNATKQDVDTGRPDLSPRHYMIISKPCDHPETQPRDGFVRGNYESVEFIREVPRLPTKTRSSLDLRRLSVEKGNPLEKKAVLRTNDTQTMSTFLTSHENKSMNDLSAVAKANESTNRRRGKTISFSDSKADDMRAGEYDDESYDPESNPVEWIMVTRSDPGGSVPRFMVERGTPGSIVADASKFLDWACQNEHVADSKYFSAEFANRRDSFASYEANGHLAGINGDTSKGAIASDELPSSVPSTSSHSPSNSANQSGILSSVTGTFAAGLEVYAPQMVLDRLPGHNAPGSEDTTSLTSTNFGRKADEDDEDDEDDTSDSLSTTSFASADSHFENEESDAPRLSPSTTKSSSLQQKDKSDSKSKSKDKDKKTQLTPHEKELQKLSARRTALDAKLASTLSKSTKNADAQTSKEREAIRKAEEKHAKELAKQEERYKREVGKIEERRAREQKKAEEKKRKEGEKERRSRVERERDEAVKEVKVLKGEGEVWRKQVGELQRENTGLVAKVGRLEKELKELKERGAGKEAGLDSTGEAEAAEDQSETGKRKQNGKDKAKNRDQTSHPVPALMDKDPVKNLLKEEKAQGSGSASARGAGARMRGVSFGSSSTNASADSVRSSRSSGLLKRGVSMGMGMGAGAGAGAAAAAAGKEEMGKGGSS